MAKGVPMEDALTPEECNRMSVFLSLLSKLHKQHGKINVSKFIDQYVIALHGKKIRKTSKPRVWTKEKADRVIELRRSGTPWKDIAKEFNCSVSSVTWALLQNNEGSVRV